MLLEFLFMLGSDCNSLQLLNWLIFTTVLQRITSLMNTQLNAESGDLQNNILSISLQEVVQLGEI